MIYDLNNGDALTEIGKTLMIVSGGGSSKMLGISVGCLKFEIQVEVNKAVIRVWGLRRDRTIDINSGTVNIKTATELDEITKRKK